MSSQQPQSSPLIQHQTPQAQQQQQTLPNQQTQQSPPQHTAQQPAQAQPQFQQQAQPNPQSQQTQQLHQQQQPQGQAQRHPPPQQSSKHIQQPATQQHQGQGPPAPQPNLQQQQQQHQLQPPQQKPYTQNQYAMPPNTSQQQQQPPLQGSIPRPFTPNSAPLSQLNVNTSSAAAYYGNSQPAAKRQRVSPDPRSGPASPYNNSPYSASPVTTSAPPSAISPVGHYPSQPQGGYQGPYTTPLSVQSPLVHASPYTAAPPPPSTYQPVQPNNLHHTPAHIQPNYAPPQPQYQSQNNYVQQQPQPPQHPGTMGPPPGPPFRAPAKDENANDDQMDVLANAGVDLRAEEAFAMSFQTGSYNSQPTFGKGLNSTTGVAFNQFAPGGTDSFYGSGPANQPGVPADTKSQAQVEKEAADQAWRSATSRLAQSRQHELNHPHTHVGALWSKMDKIARENGLTLSTDNGKMPQLKLPHEFNTTQTIKTEKGPDGAMVLVKGNFLPADTALADQLALMSLATNTRMRILLEEVIAVSRGRRIGSHGVVPAEYAGIAIAQSPAAGTIVQEYGPRAGFVGAVSPRTNPPNARLPTPAPQTPVGGTLQMTNELIKALRESASKEREFEEKRLAKRAARLANPTAILSTPATPGSIAPESGAKPLTKKEREKQDKGKQSIVDSHAQANATTATFLFGGKKKNKYSWMESGGASGASTPRASQGGGGALGGPPEKVRLTQDGKNRMGGFREDRDGGKYVQLRDLVTVLEHDGREKGALQRIYPWLDAPKPKPGPQL